MKRVHIIDDEESLLEICGIVLDAAGYVIIVSHGAHNGLRDLKRSKPDLILLDWVMPDMNGGKVVKKIKADSETAAIPVLMMSALPEIQAEAHILGTEGFIQKPFSAEQLVREIGTIIECHKKKLAA